MAATIKDIARMVGVSPSTVSRVLNGSAPISDATKDRIHQAMKELDYHPNSIARSFANGSTYTIGLVINAKNENTFANNFFNKSVYAIETVAQRHNYNVLITNEGSKKDGASISSLVYEKKVDGLLIPPASMTAKLESFLKGENFPFVVLGQTIKNRPGVSWVDIDNANGSKQATEHFISQGYKSIALIVEDNKTVFSKKRIEGYRQGITDFCRECVIEAGKDYEELEKKAVDFYSNGKADAFLCSSNEIAFHVLKALKSAGIAVPKEAGIITFDNYPLAEYMDPPLTAIDVDTYSLGKLAAELLISKMGRLNNSEKIFADNNLIKTTLLVRGSSKRMG